MNIWEYAEMTSEKVKKSIEHALEQLHEEKERIENAIDKLEIFLGNLLDAAGGGRARGRAAKGSHSKPAQRSRAGWTDEARDAARARMRKYWAERRKNAANASTARREKRAGEARANRAAAKSGKSMSESATRQSDKKGWSPEAREAARERMRHYWEQRRKSAASG